MKAASNDRNRARVTSVSLSPRHAFSKDATSEITLIAGQGVVGDAHCGETVKHRSRVAKDPTQPNLRQVHLIHAELFDELAEQGFDIDPGELGENITTRGIALLELPTDTTLHIGDSAIIRITGLRNPCSQIEQHQSGLLSAVLDRDDAGRLIRKSGVMAVVLESGQVHPGDLIRFDLPPEPHRALERV